MAKDVYRQPSATELNLRRRVSELEGEVACLIADSMDSALIATLQERIKALEAAD